MLIKYGVLSENSITSGHVKRMLDRYKFIEHQDYLLSQVGQQVPSGTKYKNEYYLHPNTFKMCLMGSANTRKYANYYLFLEKSIKYFNDYQMELNLKYIIKLKTKILKKDNKISSLEIKLDTIIENNEKLLEDNKKTLDELIKSNEMNEKMKKYLEDANIKLDKTFDQLVNTNNKLTNISSKLDIATEERIPKPSDDSKYNTFVLYKHKTELNKYYVVRRQRISAKTVQLKNYIKLKEYDYTANAITLLQNIKHQLSNSITCSGNKIILKNLSEFNFLKEIDKIHNQKITKF